MRHKSRAPKGEKVYEKRKKGNMDYNTAVSVFVFARNSNSCSDSNFCPEG